MKQPHIMAMALTAALGLATLPAHAAPLIAQTPSVTIAVASVESQAQLAQTLVAQGYTNVVLSAERATPANPYPELNPTATTHAATTPVRDGWNGVAEKDGQTVQVYVTGL